MYLKVMKDRRLVELSGLLQMLEPGDEIMADKGFLIQDLLAPLGVRSVECATVFAIKEANAS